MLSKTIRTAVYSALLLAGASVSAYDHDLAASYAELFEPVAGAKAGKALHLISPEALVESIKKGEEVVALDVRTPAESGLFTMSVPGSLAIPASELFKVENLDRLPEDKRIVVVCKSGTRAAAVGTALRHVGFGNVYILKGGFMKLASYLDAKASNSPPKPDKVAAR